MEFKLNNVYQLLNQICKEVGYNGISINYSTKDTGLSLTLWGSNKKYNIKITEKYLDTELNQDEIINIIEWLKNKDVDNE